MEAARETAGAPGAPRPPKRARPRALAPAIGSALLLLAAACRTPERPAEPRPEPAEAPRRPRAVVRDVLLATGEVVGLPSPQDIDLGSGLDAAGDVARAPRKDGEAEGDDEDDGGRWLVAPIPFVDPTIGYGLALGGAYLWKLDEGSPPSTLGGGGLYSENGSYGGALGFKGYLDDDRFRVATGVVATRLNFDLSTDAGAIPLRENIVGFAAELLVRVGERVYAGPQVLMTGIDTDVKRVGDQGVLPDDELDTFNVALGGRVQRDTRDSTFYPRSGSFADAQLRVFDPALGSPFAYRVLPASYDLFLSSSEKGVVALRAAGRFAFGDVPFYGESFFGAGGDLRGYPVGDYQDNVLLAGQAEYRRELVGRLGAVAFAGVGTVADDLEGLDDATALPSLGLGLRFTLEEKNHVNFRIDVAWGRDDAVVYLGVGEAF